MKKVLFVVDAQNDFMPGGALPVPYGDEIIPVINDLLKQEWDIIYFSKDWHPETHTSFAINHKVEPFTMVRGEMKWPVHCVKRSWGAAIHESIVHTHPIEKNREIIILLKGQDVYLEQYSAIDIDDIRCQTLADMQIVLCGLATDYCVKATAIDLVKAGAKVIVDLNGCRGVNPETTIKAIEEMKQYGIELRGPRP